MRSLRQLSVIAIVVAACGTAPTPVESSAPVVVDTEAAAESTIPPDETVPADHSTMTSVTQFDSPLCDDLDSGLDYFLMGEPGYGATIYWGFVMDNLPREESEPRDDESRVEWFERLDRHTLDECGAPYLSLQMHTFFTCGASDSFGVESVVNWGPCVDPREEAVEIAPPDEQLSAIDELGRLLEEQDSRTTGVSNFEAIESALEAEDFEDLEALALEDGRANVAVELSSTETVNGTFEITAVVSTLSDFADLPLVLFEFAGDADLLEPLPEECSTEGKNVRCQIPGSTVPEDGPVNITISVVPTDEVSMTATVTSLNNPVSNDFDPTDNIDTLTLSR